MLLAGLLVGVTLIVLGMVLGPLAKSAKPPPERAAFDRAVFRDQLKELERDAARGVIGAEEASASRLELERRLLGTDTAKQRPGTGARKPALAAALALAIAAAAGGLYWRLGSPSFPDDPYAARQAERDQETAREAQLTQIKTMVAGLAERLKATPDDLAGWLQLGRSYAVLGQPDDAAAAFAKAERLKPDDPAILMAEAQAALVNHAISDPIPERRARSLAPGPDARSERAGGTLVFRPQRRAARQLRRGARGLAEAFARDASG